MCQVFLHYREPPWWYLRYSREGLCLACGIPATSMVCLDMCPKHSDACLTSGRFESGDLLKATRVGEFDYELSLRTDLYKEKHTQGFHFQVRNTLTSLCEEGQLPLLYSEEIARVQGVGWHRVGQQASFQCNVHQHTNQPCYSLSWTFCFPYYQVLTTNATHLNDMSLIHKHSYKCFPYDKDTCYCSHCYPYTYSNLWAHPKLCEESKVLLYFDLHGHSHTMSSPTAVRGRGPISALRTWRCWGGAPFCDTLLDYCELHRTKIQYQLVHIRNRQRHQSHPSVMFFLQYSACVRATGDDEVGGSTSGSNSLKSDGPPAHLQAFNKVVTVVVAN
ncbi:unnamed protein product [Coregonus sp. 'balchen']|nr:unnamed protein product [Coregonus sp. 'balchen']